MINFEIMDSQYLYLNDPLTLEFTAEVREKWALPGGRTGVVLDRTYFYPTGGGQEHDVGYIGAARVVEVIKDSQAGRLVHVLDRDIPAGPVQARIDAGRRLRHMQHHTAQHLLTQCCLRLFDLETLSANINGYTPSTLDLPESSLSKDDLDRAENLANSLIYQNLPVKSYFVTPEELEGLPLRKKPAVSENIRIVEIQGFDYTPCGGTHCLATGSVGVLKILRTERQNEKTRLHFIAGQQALEYFRELQEIVSGLAGQMSVHPRDLASAVQRQADGLRAAEKELAGLRLLRVQQEAQQLAAGGDLVSGRRVIVATFEGRSMQELRALADEIRKMASTVGVLASYDGQKLSLLAACALDSGLEARRLVAQLAAQFGGRGGGDASLAQGGGAASLEQFRSFPASVRSTLQEWLNSRQED